uniref:Uncharacterized protein n=1 Tax=Panagrolaimus sp. PS1159 TaxID=55785 RepID=A0AC35GI24_9BILA
MGLSSNPLWLHHLKRILGLSNRIKLSAVGQNVVQKRIRLGKHLLTYNGKQMVFTIEEEREMHFNQLQKQW